MRLVEDGDSLLEGGRKGGRIRSLDITGLVSISRGKDSGQGRPLLLVWSEERKGEEERERRIGRGVSGREKIKQIGMQRTTTGGWNEGGVKLGQLGVAAPRGWDQYSLFLSSALAPTIATAHRDTRTFLRFSPLFSFLHTYTHIYIYIYIYTPVFLFPRWFVTRASQPIPPPAGGGTSGKTRVLLSEARE